MYTCKSLTHNNALAAAAQAGREKPLEKLPKVDVCGGGAVCHARRWEWRKQHAHPRHPGHGHVYVCCPRGLLLLLLLLLLNDPHEVAKEVVNKMRFVHAPQSLA
jgi:hypothetical protein